MWVRTGSEQVLILSHSDIIQHRQPFFFFFTSIGLTMMVRAESSHWLLPSLDPPLEPSPRRWMERMRNTPRITMTTRKPTHTMMMTVAAPGTTVKERKEDDHDIKQNKGKSICSV